MPEKEMFAKILSDYLATEPQDAQAVETLQVFCKYATKWLSDAGLVGVGHTTNGISLRFADSSEYLLTSALAVETNSVDTPAFSITGNNGGSARSSGAMQDSSMRITG